MSSRITDWNEVGEGYDRRRAVDAKRIWCEWLRYIPCTSGGEGGCGKGGGGDGDDQVDQACGLT